MTLQSRKQSKNSSQPPEGQVLKVRNHNSGLSTVELDNGVPHTITIVSRTEDLHILLGTDLADVREHLMTRKPGHFRRKS
jgi:hypothetical protein